MSHLRVNINNLIASTTRITKLIQQVKASVLDTGRFSESILTQLASLVEILSRPSLGSDDTEPIVLENGNHIKALLTIRDCLQDLRFLRCTITNVLTRPKDEKGVRRIDSDTLRWELEPVMRKARIRMRTHIRTLDEAFEVSSDTATKDLKAVPRREPFPLNTVPYARDVRFVFREETFSQLEEKLATPSTTVALFGADGLGKTHTAIELCYRLTENIPDMWVLWLDGRNATTAELSCRDIALFVGITANESSPRSQYKSAVQTWLSDERNGRWLLVVDEIADNGGAATAPAASSDHEIKSLDPFDLESFLPQNRLGSIIMTTSSEDLAFSLVRPEDAFTIEAMNQSQAEQLLKTHLVAHVLNEEVCSNLVKALAFAPLAITQAAAYINQCDDESSMHQCLSRIEEYSDPYSGLTAQAFAELPEHDEVATAILHIWQQSFLKLGVDNVPHGVGILLSQLSLFDRNSIPKWVLQLPIDENDRTGEEAGADKLDTILEVLNSYGLIRRRVDGVRFDIHRLGQSATRQLMEGSEQSLMVQETYLNHLGFHFAFGEFETWPSCQELLPHTLYAINMAEGPNNQSEDSWATLMYKIGLYMWERGDYKFAEFVVRKSREWRLKHKGPENRETLRSSNMLADCLVSLGRFAEAERIHSEVLNTRKKVLGESHPDTLNSMSNVANTYWARGRFEEAKQMTAKSLELKKAVLGKENASTLTTMQNLAVILANIGDVDVSRDLTEQVLEGRKRTLGEEHSETLRSRENMAEALAKQGLHDKADNLRLQVIETSKRVKGEEHSDTLVAMHNLASSYIERELFAQGLELEATVVEIRKRTSGPEHELTLISMLYLAVGFHGAKRYDEAVAMFQELLWIRERIAGPDDKVTLRTMHRLAKSLRALDRFPEACAYMNNCLVLWKRRYGEQEVEVTMSATFLGAWKIEAKEQGIDVDALMEDEAEENEREPEVDDGEERANKRAKIETRENNSVQRQ